MIGTKTLAWSPATLRQEKFWPIDLFTRALVLLTANKLGIFESLAGGPRELDFIAKRLRADVKGTRILLDTLVALEYVRKGDGLYENEPDTARYMTRASDQYIGTRLIHTYEGLGRWLRLEDMVRHGQNYKNKLPEFQKSGTQLKKTTKEFTLGLDQSSRESAVLAADMLNLKGVRTLLDLGGGAGTYSTAFARKWPSLKATVFELPVPAKVAKQQAKKRGMQERVSVKIGDFLLDDIGSENYDAVFLSNIVHNLSPKDNLKVLKKSWRALRNGGRIFIKDMMPNDRRNGPYYPLIFALTMLMFTDAGDTYKESEVTGWLREAGFARISKRTFIRGESSILTGYKK